jgi:phosphoglycolate phosphatase/putative hydrolase of the HAD superfamily
MITYTLPARVHGLIFDMDLTLYRNEAYYASQVNNQVVLLAEELGWPVEALEARLKEWDRTFRQDNRGKKPSFGNTLLGALGYPIEKSVELRRRAVRPEDYLVEDPRLEAALAELQPLFRLVLVTNNPSDIAVRTLRVLGVQKYFPQIVGLETTGHSKPHPAAFDLAYQSLGLPPEQVVSVGDRFPVDIEVPLERGSGGILVESMDDVYSLPRILLGMAKS